ncbi:hypothetical protein FGB62_3g437 [Gracilaria domingensis]|nr:hypothetical protein FGB62_3g437 [Gracilaria domingensis]
MQTRNARESGEASDARPRVRARRPQRCDSHTFVMFSSTYRPSALPCAAWAACQAVPGRRSLVGFILLLSQSHVILTFIIQPTPCEQAA